jgi:hypothetical protein
MATLSADIFAVPDGEVHPRWFRAGEAVTGAVAEAAKAQGKLVQAQRRAPRNKAARPPEVKND